MANKDKDKQGTNSPELAVEPSPLHGSPVVPTMSNLMEVDSDTSPPQLLGPAFTPTPPAVPSLQDKINLRMNKIDWSDLMKMAGNDAKKQAEVFGDILSTVLYAARSEINFIDIPPSARAAEKLIEGLDEKGLKEWQDGVKAGIKTGDWAVLASHSILRKSAKNVEFLNREIKDFGKQLAAFYKTPFVGNTATDLVDYLKFLEVEIKMHRMMPYAKAFPVVQASGTGKSRMLTEAGRHIFTLPICLRGESSPGYPPPDLEVVKYFDSFGKVNDLSYTAHIAVASFIAAAHTTMLKRLKAAQEQNLGNLHGYWHQGMESGDRDYRDAFFSEVTKLASALKDKHRNLRTGETPKRKNKVDDEDESKSINEFAQKAYESITMKATQDLMSFLSIIELEARCVTYFDEAHDLDKALWVLLRLVQYQRPSTQIWYIFMGTKSSVSYYAPNASDMSSLKLIREMARLLPPYTALGFDHHAIANAQKPLAVTIGEIQSIKHLAQYGRPLWKASLERISELDLITLAAMKLTNGTTFSPTEVQHVFALLSQRLCLDPVLSGTDAVKLADRSVAHHMRLLLGLSDNGALFYTHSPSEPMLALGASSLLYDTKKQLPDSLKTLSVDLCGAGIVEKGIMGELAARTLLLVARDFTVTMKDQNRDLLKPVLLLHFLDKLLGKEWAGKKRPEFDTAFAHTYVNFTHWIVTKDKLPVEPDSKLLANLWARGAALQCSFGQKAIDFTIPTYRCEESFEADAVFDPSRLSGVSGQVKLKVVGEPQAESRIQPLGIPRDPSDPLPYLALLMELGSESKYQSQGKIKATPSEPTSPDKFLELTTTLATAAENYAVRLQQVGKNRKDPELMALKEALNKAQLATDMYNRYAISIRGASPEVYQILETAEIATEFATLLDITMRVPGKEKATIQHMCPLERLEDGSNHTAWMVEYVVPEVKMELD